MKTVLPVTWQRGVNLDTEDYALAESEVRGTTNMFPDASGVSLRTRPAMKYLRTLSLQADLYPTALEYTSLAVQDLLIAGVRSAAGQNKVIITDGVTEVIETFGYENSRPTVTSLAGNTFIFNGRTDTGWQGVVLRPSTVGGLWEAAEYAMGGIGNGTAAPKLCTTWQNRLVLANFGRGKENMIVVSDIANPTSFSDYVLDPTGGLNRVINSSDGDELVCVKEVFLTGTGTPSESALLCLKRHSAYLVTGRWPLSTDLTIDPLELRVQRISANAGCASHQTFQITKYGVIWAGPDDVWFMPYGSQPYPIGRKIRSRFGLTPTNLQFAWHSGFDDDIYRLAIYGDGPQNGQYSDTDSVIQSSVDGYRACDEQWWLDLRQGPPQNWQEARWFGPQVYNSVTTHYNPIANLADDNVQYRRAVVGTWCMGKDPKQQDYPLMTIGVHGSVSARTPTRLTLCTMDGKSNFDTMGVEVQAQAWQPDTAYAIGDAILVPNALAGTFEGNSNYYQAWKCTTAGVSAANYNTRPTFNVSPQTDNTVTWTKLADSSFNITDLDKAPQNCIPTELKTGQIHGGDLMTDKLFQGVEISAKSTTPAVVTTTADNDYGSYLDQHNGTENPTGSTLGTLVLGTSTLKDPPSTYAIYLDADARPVSKSMQLMVSSEGQPNVYTLDTPVSLSIAWYDPFAVPQGGFVSIPAGSYTPLQLWTYFVTQFNIRYNTVPNGNMQLTQTTALHGARLYFGFYTTYVDWMPLAGTGTSAAALWEFLGWVEGQYSNASNPDGDPLLMSANNYPAFPVPECYENDLTLRQLNLVARGYKRRPV